MHRTFSRKGERSSLLRGRILFQVYIRKGERSTRTRTGLNSTSSRSAPPRAEGKKAAGAVQRVLTKVFRDATSGIPST